jgi:hypothetical protein
MAADNVTPIRRPPDAPVSDTINALSESLAHARATLDLILGLTTDVTGVALESLDEHTLGWALAGAIARIDQAVAAAERLSPGTPAPDGVRP